MNEKLQIRRMTAEEIPAIDAMQNEIYQDTAAPLEFLIEDFNDPNGHLYVAYWGGELAGHCAMQYKTADNASYCNISNLMVEERFRKKGIGRLMMIEMLNKTKELGLTRAALKVATDNSAAIDLYKSFGFQVEELIPDFYADEDGDAYVMRLHPQ